MADDVLEINLEHLTIDEINEVEERTGQGFDSFSEKGSKKGKLLQALAFVIKRRTDPDFTWEQAGSMKVSIAGGDTVPPTSAAG